ncbi:MAG TPA: YggS family pyridoxal phosphate-dependent enzyme, partial [bacterium]|nr:YggS family pyridoxal phosphate-dependent enzyme [bacterium]
NKASVAASLFDAIDSVDSLRIAERVSEESLKLGKTMPALIQVNSSGESSKHGFAPEEIEKAADEVAKLEGLSLIGLMTIGPLTDDEGEIRRAFAETRILFDKLRAGRRGFDILSMGMSDDYEAAIEEGSTMARIGRAIFERRT